MKTRSVPGHRRVTSKVREQYIPGREGEPEQASGELSLTSAGKTEECN